jgi:hypothetical protein
VTYPDWNVIPDLSFTCEGVSDPSLHADITVSHQARSIRINGAEAGPMTKSAAMYNNVRNRFGSYVIVIEVSRVEGPTWMLAEGPNRGVGSSPIYVNVTLKLLTSGLERTPPNPP